MYDFKNVDDKNLSVREIGLLKINALTFTAIESVLLIYEFGFYKLNFGMGHSDVRKGNEKVINFHKRFGAK